MPAIASEKALRKLVIELAAATPEDIVAVLAMLNPRARASVQSLLAAYTDVPDVFDLDVAPAVATTAGLSDWLSARIQGIGAAGEEFHITAKTSETLRMIVATMPRSATRTQNEGAGR
jgi:hypothetical protein